MSKKKKRFMRTTPDTGPGAFAGANARYDFNPDYTDVKKDLRRIGLLAGFFILVLVGLSLFLR